MRPRRWVNWVHHVAALLATALFVLPLYWAAVAALGQVGAPPPRSVVWWPPDAQWVNYARLFEYVPLWRYTRNSLIVAGVGTPLAVLTASLAGFALAELPDNGRRRLYMLSIVLLIIPSASVWFFRFQVLRLFGLLDSLVALIVPALAAGSPLFVLLYYWSFRRLPRELFEAARLDGASAVAVWRQIAMPLARPTTMAVALLAFVLHWNDFVSPVLYLFEPRNYTLPVGVQIVNQLDSTNWPLMMAVAVYATAPVLLVFGYIQRFFLRDLSPAQLFDRN